MCVGPQVYVELLDRGLRVEAPEGLSMRWGGHCIVSTGERRDLAVDREQLLQIGGVISIIRGRRTLSIEAPKSLSISRLSPLDAPAEDAPLVGAA